MLCVLVFIVVFPLLLEPESTGLVQEAGMQRRRVDGNPDGFQQGYLSVGG
jgi:hypothetical protein